MSRSPPCAGDRRCRHIIIWEFRFQPIARLTRLAMTHAVRKNQIVAARVERPARIEQSLGKDRTQKCAAVSTSPMQDEDRIVDIAVGVAMRRTEGRIMDLQVVQRLAIVELIIIKPGIFLHGGWIDLPVPKGSWSLGGLR